MTIKIINSFLLLFLHVLYTKNDQDDYFFVKRLQRLCVEFGCHTLPHGPNTHTRYYGTGNWGYRNNSHVTPHITNIISTDRASNWAQPSVDSIWDGISEETENLVCSAKSRDGSPAPFDRERLRTYEECVDILYICIYIECMCMYTHLRVCQSPPT